MQGRCCLGVLWFNAKKMNCPRIRQLVFLPALGMVTSEGFAVEVLVPAARVDIVVLLHVGTLGVLLQVGNVVRSMAPLEHRVCGRRLLRPLPEQVTSERLGKLSGEHVSARGTGREGSLGVQTGGVGHDWLGRGARDFVD